MVSNYSLLCLLFQNSYKIYLSRMLLSHQLYTLIITYFMIVIHENKLSVGILPHRWRLTVQKYRNSKETTTTSLQMPAEFSVYYFPSQSIDYKDKIQSLIQ